MEMSRLRSDAITEFPPPVKLDPKACLSHDGRVDHRKLTIFLLSARTLIY